MGFIEWIFKLLYGEDAANDLRPSPKRKRR
jgi:hypothetical protein